ncbi:hypothetical protein BGZ47_005977 [Haplosporangium gracile]|nr:hypothetical protein BGZ47_005977 [Haplosporangium gracile]
MLAVNFVFLIEADYQTGGLQVEVEDETWNALCNAVKDPVPSLLNEDIIEIHQWARRLAQNKQGAFERLLDEQPLRNRSLKSILTDMVGTAQLWSTRVSNEDTYLKSKLTQTQDETREPSSNLMIPDFSVTTRVEKQELSLLLLEGKIVGNMGRGQVWDDLTKLGQEMKLALVSILMLLPEGGVCVVGLLVRESSIDFYTMHLRAEATYVLNRFASAFVAPETLNVSPLAQLMEAFEHAKSKLEGTVEQIRKVKLRPSTNPLVPLWWLRPSFSKPVRRQVVDTE